MLGQSSQDERLRLAEDTLLGLKYWVGRGLLRVLGWKEEGASLPPGKYVIIAAPHTSNWDLPLMLAMAFVLDLDPSWMGKHTLFKPPFGWFMRMLGGIPIERHKRSSVVQQMVELFGQRETLQLTVPAEGSRSRREYWKSGFYHIAAGADVPVVLSFLDYRRKRGGIGPIVRVTGDIAADMDVIRAFYADKAGKFPEKFATPRLKEEDGDTEAAERDSGE